MILEIKGLRLTHSRSPTDIQSVLMDTFNIGSKDILFTDYVNNSIQCEVSNERIGQKMLSHNGRKLRDLNCTLTVRKMKRNNSNGYSHSHERERNERERHSQTYSYSNTLFKINKIPLNWDISDVVKYFSVSCNAPLRTCYRLNQDNENISMQYVFVEFISSDCAQKARNILERTANCLGIIPIQTKNISKILQYYPSYIAPKHTYTNIRKLPIDNNGGSRAYGTHNKNKPKRGYLHYKNRNKNKSKKKRYKYGHGSSLNGHRIKKQLEQKRDKYFDNKYAKSKDKYFDESYNKFNKNREITIQKQCNNNKKRAKDVKDVKDVKDKNMSDCSHSSCGSDCSSSNDCSYSSSYSYSSSDSNDIICENINKNNVIEEGEILKKKLRHITSKSISKQKGKEKTKENGYRNNKCKNNNGNMTNRSPKSASIASFSASPPKHMSLNGNGKDKLCICGIAITSASEIKEITSKIELSSQFQYANTMKDSDIVAIWNDIISFFIRNPKHYIIHLDYVCNLIVILIRCHGYILPLCMFIKLPITFLLELCEGNSIKIIEEFLNIKYQRFHAQFQQILIANIHIIIKHNSGNNLIKIAFKKLCKTSLYNIVQIIDKNNYKQLSKELIPIIRNRTNQIKTQTQPLEDVLNTNYSSSPMSCDMNEMKNDRLMVLPPPPPPKKLPIGSSLLALEFESNGCSNGNGKREIDIIYPPRKKAKISHGNISKKPTDPRVNRMNGGGNNAIKIAYKKRKNCQKMEYFEFNINVKDMVGIVENCIEKLVQLDNGLVREHVMDMYKSLSDSFRNKYKLDKYFTEKGVNYKYFDMKFYENIFDIMNIVFKMPERIYSVIELNENNTKENSKHIMHKLRNICKEETVLFINMNENNKYSFGVCSQRLGIVSINCDFNKIFEGLMNNNNNIFDDECVKHFTFIYNLWKKQGVNREDYPMKRMENNYMNCNNENMVWVNCFIAYLYLVLDICRIDYSKILNKYMNKVMNVSFDIWNGLFPIRIFDFLFENVKQIDKIGGIENVQANFYRELPMINGH